MSKNILLLGGGGHFRSVLDCAVASGDYDRIGLVAKNREEAEILSGNSEIPVAGIDDDLEKLVDEGWKYAFVAVGSVGYTGVREKIFRLLRNFGYQIPVIADPSAVISRSARLAQGVFVGKRAVINAGSTAGECAIINTGAIIEHDCRIGAFAHISSGTVLCGGVEVGERSHIGAGSVVRQNIRICEGVMIGAGSVLVKDIPAGATAFGNPCRIVEK